MHCNVGWSFVYLYEALPKAFIMGDLKRHQQDFLLNRAKAYLPEFQERAEREKVREKNIIICRQMEQEKQELHRIRSQLMMENAQNVAEKKTLPSKSDRFKELVVRNREIVAQKKEVNGRIYDLNETIRNLRHGNYADLDEGPEGEVATEGGMAKGTKKYQARRKCPSEECRGFLDGDWKCGICQKKTCRRCYVLLDGGEHTCREEDVETMKLLKKETKPCPKCGMGITKIDGCFAPDTQIPMWDGTTKLVQEIQVGDVLIGDDGTPRNVLELCSGTSPMFEIQQNKADNYTVNQYHTLSLWMNRNEVITIREGQIEISWVDHKNKCRRTETFDQKEEAFDFLVQLRTTNVLEITVHDYLLLPKAVQDLLFGYQSKRTPEMEVQSPTNVSLTPIKVVPVGEGTYFGFKVDGNSRFVLTDYTVVRNCNQMFCTLCHSVFDWATGKETNTHVHNPHYFEWRRRMGENGRTVGDLPCGGLPNFIDPHDRKYGEKIEQCNVILRKTHEINELRNAPLRDRDNDADLGVKYLLNQIDEAHWKKLLADRDRKEERVRAYQQIVQMYILASTDIFQKIVRFNNKNHQAELEEAIKELDALVIYYNDEITKLGQLLKSGYHSYLITLT